MAGESIAVAIYKLGIENQQYIAGVKQATQASDQLVAANMRVVDSEEKAGRASSLRANFIEAENAKFDRAQKAQDLYARQIARVAQAEQEGLGTAASRAQLLQNYSNQLNKTIADLERKAKAERDAAQAEREAEAAAKNLARIEGEHALALKNTAAALGVDQGALIAAANAGNRHAAATLDMMNKLVGLNKSLQEGRGNLLTHAQEVDRVQAAYRNNVAAIATQDAAMKKSSTVTGLARYELINLSRQFQDIGVSLAGGQSPFRILIEQGSQIADIFASSKAAFGQVFSSMIAWAARAATSIIGVVTAVAALGVAGGALAISWVEGQRQIERALVGVGERSGLTVKDVNRISESASQSTKLSISAAREAAIEFIKTGEIYGENVARAVNLTDKFALATGTTAATAAKTLAESLSDPVKGAQELNKEFGFLDGKTLQLIRTLVAAGREQEAQRVLMEKMAPKIKEAADAASGWAKIWMEATQALSIYVTELQKLVTWQEKLRGLTGPIQPAAGAGRFGAGRAAEQRPARDPAELLGLSALDKQLESLRDKWSRLANEAIRSNFAQIPAVEALKKQLTDLKRAQDDLVIKGKTGLAEQLQPAIDGVRLRLELENDSLRVQKLQAEAVKKVADAYNKSAEEEGKISVQTALTANSLDKQIAVYTARNRAGVEAAVNEQKINELMLQGKSLAEAQLIITKQQTLAHAQNMTALKEQLTIAEARTGRAKINAQYEADINQRLREGATLEQATAEASMKRKIAIENVNTAIREQIHSLEQENELIQARLDGDYASVKAAQAYENAIRQGADNLHAAALEAAVLENELVKAAAASSRIGVSLGGNLGAKLAAIGAGGAVGMTGIQSGEPGSIVHTQVGGGGPLVGAAGMSTAFNKAIAFVANAFSPSAIAVYQEAVQAQEAAAAAAKNAATAQQQAAVAATDAARQQSAAAVAAAKAARDTAISAADAAAKETIATKLLAGQSVAAVNMLIEQGAIPFGTASTRFQTQLDLYKRAGASNAQIAADIRSGIIGEGAKPSELLAALDSLTNAVDSNTAAQIGLSDFYTQQGDRLLGYRGYNVQTGIRSPIGATAPGTPGVGTGAIGGMDGGGIMGGVVNPIEQVSFQTQPQTQLKYINNTLQSGYYDANGQWTKAGTQPTLKNGYWTSYTPGSGIKYSVADALYHPSTVRLMAEGGIADRPMLGMFGEAGPEAFVPLKGGAIPVRLTGNNDNKPTTIVNINAPLVNFIAEPTRDEVRESAFQASQMLRRVASGG